MAIITEARRLKTVRQVEGEIENGRRYSRAYIAFVEENESNLMNMRLCKKAIVKILRCSLNFLYQRKNAPGPRRTPLSTSKLKGLVSFYSRAFCVLFSNEINVKKCEKYEKNATKCENYRGLKLNS